MELGEIVVIPAFAFVVAGGEPKGRGTVDCGTGASFQSHIVNVAVEGVRAQVGQVDPGVATIQTLINPSTSMPAQMVRLSLGSTTMLWWSAAPDGAIHVYAHMKLAPRPPPIPGAESIGPRAHK